MQHGLDRGGGIDLWDTSWGTRLDQGDGIDSKGHAIGVWHWLGHVMGARLNQRDGIDLWGHDMGVRHWLDVNDEIDLWGYSMGARNWIGTMELIYGGEPWCWLVLGEGIDLCGHVMRARDTGWIGVMVEWQSTIRLLNLNDDTMCLMSGVKVSAQSMFG